MGEIAIHLPPDLERDIEDLISRGIYSGKEEAIIALVRAGLASRGRKEEPGAHMMPEFPPPPLVKPPERWPNHYEFKE